MEETLGESLDSATTAQSVGRTSAHHIAHHEDCCLSRCRLALRHPDAIARDLAFGLSLQLAGSLFLPLTHVLDVESNSLFRPSQSESTPARFGRDTQHAFPSSMGTAGPGH